MVAPPNDQLRFNQLFQRRISHQRKVIKADKLLQPAESRIFTKGHSGNELLALQHLLFCHEIARTTVSRLLQWRQQTEQEDKSSLDGVLSGSSKRHSDHDRQSWQEQTASLCCYEIITQLGANSFCWRGEGPKHWLRHPRVTLETKGRDCWFSPDATDPRRESGGMEESVHMTVTIRKRSDGLFSCPVFGETSLGGIKERSCVIPNLNVIQKQNKPQIRLNTWLEPKWALSPQDISHDQIRVHQWGNRADFIIYSLPGQLEGEPKLGKSPELMDSLKWSARKAKPWVQTFPSTLGRSVKDILSVFNSAHLWCSGGYHSDGMSMAGRGSNIATWS